MSRLPAVRDGMLYSPSHHPPIPVESQEWYVWLEDARSFTFACPAGTFTARHEERSGRHFWYAYRQQHGALRKTYLGRSAELTLPRLEQAAATLAQAVSTPARSDSPHEQSIPLIATKMCLPQPGPSLIARPAVIARCLESVETRPCTLLAAPPGFGKTTLLVTASEQLKDRGWHVAWVSLEETERDPVRFWMYLLAALDGVQPGVAFAARNMLETPRPSPIERILTALINELAATTTPITLVLDDYHRAATPDSDRGLEFLLEHAPATLHLVLATRADPALPLTRLRVQGKIAEFHAADLRFSPDEATRFMSETMRLTLPPHQLAQLNERTEGWVAGLQLAALSLRDQASIPDRLADLSATPRYIAEYLIDEVLERQPQDTQMFLLQTAMLERLTGPLCDAVTGRTDSAAMLARLTQAQLFVTPLDAARTWYRYHQLFAEVLCQRLRTTAPDLLEQSHRRAAHWLQQHGMLDEAIQQFIAAPAFEEAATLIEGESDRLVLRGEVAGLVTWAHALPRDILLQHPHLCVLFATGLFLQGRSPEATTWLDDLEQSLQASGSYPAETEGEIATIRAIVLLLAGDVDGGVALARQATKQLSSENQLMSSLALWLSNLLDLFGEDDLSELNRTITEIAEQSQRAGNILVAVMALMTKASIEISQCRLHRAAQTAREAIQITSHPSGRELPLATIAYSILGEIQREWNDLDAAEHTLRHALDIGSYLNSPEFVNDAIVSLGMVLAARGKYDEALATFEEVRRLVQAGQLVAWDVIQMEVMRVRVLIAQGLRAEAVRWADDCRRNWQMERPHHLVVLREAENLALARVALSLGQPVEPLSALHELSESASRGGRFRNAMEANMLLARARWMTGERDAAFCDLDVALALAAPEGFMRIFLDEGEPMADLLAAYVASRPQSTERTYAIKLLAASGRSVESTPQQPSSSVTLSQRERDVLQLLAAGYSNEAIATELVVALSTVKWHVAHIYRKLGVTSRVQAVSRAHDLHLIA